MTWQCFAMVTAIITVASLSSALIYADIKEARKLYDDDEDEE